MVLSDTLVSLPMDTPWPEAKAIYDERSPIHHVDKFSAPMIVLQGDEDAIVPPNQSEMIVDALQPEQRLVYFRLKLFQDPVRRRRGGVGRPCA